MDSSVRMEGRWVEWNGTVSDLDSFLLYWLIFFGFLLRRVCVCGEGEGRGRGG